MSLSSNDKCEHGMGRILTSKRLREGALQIDDYDERPCKISRTSSSSITSLPGDCIDRIFKCLETTDDRNSFGLTCQQWLRIQNNNQESLWYKRHHNYVPNAKYPKISPESFALIVCNLLIRFQHLKHLSLNRCPGITEAVASKSSQSFGSNVQSLGLRHCSVYSDMQLSLVFSWFPRLTYINLYSSVIGDKGLEALAKCCPSLETVKLSRCRSITDSGLSFLIQNCRELRSLDVSSCSSITGIGFLGCGRTLNHAGADGFKLKPEGIEAIVSGGGLECLYLNTLDKIAEVEEGCISTEAVITISKGCPLLKELSLSHCEEVELEGWEAIGQNCKELEHLHVMGCQKLCDRGLQAIYDGCNKLSEVHVDGEKNSFSSFGLELFERKYPSVMLCLLP
ncbi:hypothetical protein MKW94_006658 [Papaver nudicaule]|uniref:F-box domain-containing protein n=1 Tax=Papaver nudicaule TaxID=74823 RepID=A0AA41S6F3_PAPNU|nr:hypothetical protein [Papaver nudicaule]